MQGRLILVAVRVRIGLEEAGGIEGRVANVLPGAPVELIGAEAGDHVDGSAAGVAKLGAGVIDYHLKLGYRIGRGLHHLVGESLIGGAVLVVVQAVEEEVVEGAAQAVDVKGAFARIALGELAGAGNHAGGQLHQLRILASVQRQLGDFAVGDHLAVFAGLGLQLRRLGRGGYRGGRRGHLQGHIHALVSADRQLEFGHSRLKTLRRHLQLIGADGDVHEPELSPVVAGCRGLRPSGCVVQRYLGVWNDRSARVGHRSEHCCCVKLRPGEGCKHNNKREHCYTTHHCPPEMIHTFVHRGSNRACDTLPPGCRLGKPQTFNTQPDVIKAYLGMNLPYDELLSTLFR